MEEEEDVSDDSWIRFDEPEGPIGSGVGATFGEPSSMAVWCHIVPLATGVVGALVMYLASRNQAFFVRHHAVESLNFQITVLIGAVLSALLMSLIVGLVALVVIIVLAIGMQIAGALRAADGIWWRYPVSLRIVPGAFRL